MKGSFKIRLIVKLLVEISRKASNYFVAKIEDKTIAFTKIITISILYCILSVHQEDEDRVKIMNQKKGNKSISDLSLRLP